MDSTRPTFPDLAGKHVLITGGANGIGQAVAEAFALQSSRVSILDCDDQEGTAHAEQLNKQTSGETSAAFFHADLADEVQTISALDRAISQFGPVDVLINNAAIDPRHTFTDMTTRQWDHMFDLNVRHYFITARHILPSMIERKAGNIIMTTSMQAWLGEAQLAAYTATKAAIVGLVRSLAAEVGRHNIRVNAVAPGWTMTERQLKEHVTPEAQHKLTTEWQILPMLIQPEHQAPTFLFLASNASAPITRQTIITDAGFCKG